MADKIEELVEAALKQVTPNSSLEDIGKALDIAKTAAENAKTNREIKTLPAQMHIESLKTWASILVPIVSILALLATVLIQIYQQHVQFQANRQQSEDTQWRGLLATVKGGTSSAISDISLVPQLKTFFNSPVYGTQAREVSKRLMGNLANDAAFRDLYAAVFPDVQDTKLEDLIDISRMVARTSNELILKCAALSEGLGLSRDPLHIPVPADPTDPSGWGICSLLVKEPDAIKILKGINDGPETLYTRHQVMDIAGILFFMSREIISDLKRYSKDKSERSVDMSGILIYRSDATGIDFSGFDISRSTFSYVELSDVKLTPAAFEKFDPENSNWWDVAEINQDLLQELIQIRYPGFIEGEVIVTSVPLTKDYYAHRIEILCNPRIPTCEMANLRFQDKFTTQTNSTAQSPAKEWKPSAPALHVAASTPAAPRAAKHSPKHRK
jgi:hypothetical protein